MEKAEAKHADPVLTHLKALEVIKQEAIVVESYEAADVISKSIAFIKSAHIANHSMAKELKYIKNNLRIHLACNAMQGILSNGGTNYDTVPRKAFQIADEMMAHVDKGVEGGKEQEGKVKGTEDGLG